MFADMMAMPALKTAMMAFGVVAAASTVASAEEKLGPWPADLVCNAAVYVYWYLETPPKTVGEKDGWYEIHGPRDYPYHCRLNDGFAEFRWKDMAGNPREYDDTEYLVDGEKLTISSDGVTKKFVLAGTAWQLDV